MKFMLFACGLIAGGTLFAADKPASPKGMPQQPPQAVLIEKAIELKETDPRKYVGNISAIEEVAIRARVPGYITDVKFNEGDFVKAGQPLFEIEDATYLARVQAAKAVCEQTQAEYEFAQTNYNRQQELFAKAATAQSNIDDAVRLLRLNKAKSMAAKAALAESETQLSYTKINSPIDGVIGKMNFTRGNLVGTNSDLLADVVKYDPIYVRFAISESDYIRLFKSDPSNLRTTAKVRLQLADGSMYSELGKVTLVDNKVDSNTGTIMLWATIPNPDKKIIPGSLITVLLNKAVEKGVPAVKISAPGLDQKGEFVYVVNADNTVERRPVTLGAMVGNMQLITTGITPGENVIVDGTHKVSHGAKVNPQTAPETQKPAAK
ncbi:MAG: efflux RND transporter periplasmic adaptor subunit [Victivallaceae bacterium]